MTAFPGEENSPGRLPLSAVVIARNEAARIGKCLESLRFADEIVVVDSESDDGTAEIANRYTDRVLEVPWRGVGPQKQAGVELASHDIVLNVNGDEWVTHELAVEIGLDLFALDLAKMLCRNGSAHTTCCSLDWTAADTLPLRREIAG